MKTSSEPNPLALSAKVESSSRTEFKVLKCSHTWTINSFSYCWMKPGEELRSPIFFSEDDDKIKWRLDFFPGGRSSEKKDDIALYLTLVSVYEHDLKVKYKFYILNDKREKTNMKGNQEARTFSKKSDTDEPSTGFTQYIARSFLLDNVNGLLPDDKLTILCELTASTIIPNVPAPSSNVLLADHWGCTKNDVVKLSYMWSISNFKFCTEKTGVSIESPTFPPGDNCKFTWNLRLFPNGQNEANKENISIFLHPAKANEIDVKALYKICIINSKQEKTNAISTGEPFTFVKKSTDGRGSAKIVTRNFLMDKANDLLPDDKLTVFCEINYLTDVVSISGENKPIALEIPKCRLSNDLEILLKNEKSSDVTLVGREREFRAHKAILAARSSVFSDMFEDRMKEMKLNRVEIIDISDEALRQMLQFIYTGKIQNIRDIASALLRAAHKYDLDKLKVICEEELCTKIGIENAVDMLVLSDENKARQLKSHTVDFINAHAKEIVDGNRFKWLFVSHPELVAELAVVHLLSANQNSDSDEE